jgi:hypothetical protein
MNIVLLCNIGAARGMLFFIPNVRLIYSTLWLTLRSLSRSLLLAFWRHRAAPFVGKAKTRMSSLNYMELCRLCLVKERVSIPIFEGEGDVRQIFLKIASCLPVKVSIWSVTHAMSEMYWIAIIDICLGCDSTNVSFVWDADCLAMHMYLWVHSVTLLFCKTISIDVLLQEKRRSVVGLTFCWGIMLCVYVVSRGWKPWLPGVTPVPAA